MDINKDILWKRSLPDEHSFPVEAPQGEAQGDGIAAGIPSCQVDNRADQPQPDEERTEGDENWVLKRVAYNM